jgi:hypothetical protein
MFLLIESNDFEEDFPPPDFFPSPSVANAATEALIKIINAILRVNNLSSMELLVFNSLQI